MRFTRSGSKTYEKFIVAYVGNALHGLVFGACSATTPIVSEWRNPAYTSGSFKRIMVGGLGGDTSVRRNFEDEFVAQLRPAGIDALASYQFTPESEKSR